MEINIVNIIQAMLAPGIMVSACALLLLGINNKYSMVVNRIRVLDEEIRRYKHTKHSRALEQDEEDRMESLFHQITKLDQRIQLIRNAVVCYTTAMIFFIITCLIIGFEYAIGKQIFLLVVLSFLTGMISVLTGVIFSANEVMKGYEIVKIEINDTLKIK